jgi:hypothetical protein
MIGRGMKAKYLQIIPLPIIPLPNFFSAFYSPDYV